MMISVTLTEAKKNFYALTERALKGESVTITYGRWKKPIVRLVALEEAEKVRLAALLEACAS